MTVRERTAKIIAKEMFKIRTAQAAMDSWTVDEVMTDIKTLSEAIIKEIAKIRKWHTEYNKYNKAAHLKIRWYTKAIDTLGIKFRRDTINGENERS